MTRRTSTAFVVCLILAAGSVAQANVEPGVATDKPYQASTAFVLSLAGTGAGLATAALANGADSAAVGWAAILTMVVAPSAGQFYADEWGWGIAQTGLRAGGAGLFLAGLSESFGCLFDEHESGSCDEGAAGGLLVGGAIVFVGGTIWSLVDAPFAAHRGNDKMRLTVTPTVVRVGSENGMGMAVVGRF